MFSKVFRSFIFSKKLVTPAGVVSKIIAVENAEYAAKRQHGFVTIEMIIIKISFCQWLIKRLCVRIWIRRSEVQI